MTMYRWNSKKLSRKQHICDDRGMTYCKAENGNWKMDHLSDTPDPNRKTCAICVQLHKRGQSPKGRKSHTESGDRYKHDLFLRCREWKQVRYMILEGNDGRCECCGRSKADGAVLNVDHIKPRRDSPELALTLSNLQVLCAWCNQGKGNTERDWRDSDGLPEGASAHMDEILKH